ncbi:similar to Saccharomyces cerevisiae YDR156W RPA14 RNA polymerase I subunit A14 [Maudiozyma saulgeensis]|uniref:Similar to Saccharomyces cerevisiae YDR156W RPA14 RNA polymerase I subunit A14 n=1 Tax=Maudiozyma saulgeensis TaxID=1789683 RepID=A0A1X7R6J1_9SACH|nr:similar to Saccharomyces cerevisiae YDR156W RPA14 RNA polymerase I subunit A14 [Kazachstania saulgeensis]
MFKGTRRAGFTVATPLNTPIVMHKVGKAQHVSKDDVLGFLEKFITEKESIDSVNTNGASTIVDGQDNNEEISATSVTILNIDTNLSSAISQLKRVQRDFKGLPPLSFTPVTNNPVNPASNTIEEVPATSVTTEHGEETVTTSATGGKKVTFDE